MTTVPVHGHGLPAFRWPWSQSLAAYRERLEAKRREQSLLAARIRSEFIQPEQDRLLALAAGYESRREKVPVWILEGVQLNEQARISSYAL